MNTGRCWVSGKISGWFWLDRIRWYQFGWSQCA